MGAKLYPMWNYFEGEAKAEPTKVCTTHCRTLQMRTSKHPNRDKEKESLESVIAEET